MVEKGGDNPCVFVEHLETRPTGRPLQAARPVHWLALHREGLVPPPFHRAGMSPRRKSCAQKRGGRLGRRLFGAALFRGGKALFGGVVVLLWNLFSFCDVV